MATRIARIFMAVVTTRRRELDVFIRELVWLVKRRSRLGTFQYFMLHIVVLEVTEPGTVLKPQFPQILVISCEFWPWHRSMSCDEGTLSAVASTEPDSFIGHVSRERNQRRDHKK